MAWNRREHLKISARRMNEAAADLQATADAGGDQHTSATRAKSSAGFYQRMAEEYTRELLDDQ